MQKTSNEENSSSDRIPVQQGKPLTKTLNDVLVPHSPPPLSAAIVNSESITRTESTVKDLCNDTIDPEPIQTSDSYTVPGSSGTMKETHIFTPSKPNINASDSSLPPNDTVLRSDIASGEIDQFKSESIVIKENVVKKEYRDVEYEPNKLMKMSSDDFTEFQFVEPDRMPCNPNTLVQPTSMSFFPDVPDKSNEISPNEIDLNSFDSSIKKRPPSVDQDVIRTIDPLSNQSSNISSLNNGNRLKYECSMDRSLPSYNNNINANSMPNETLDTLKTNDSMEIFSISPINQMQTYSASKLNQTSSNPRELRQTQYTNAEIANSSISNNYFSSSHILMPQNVSSQTTSRAAYNPSTIQWPEPGINSDQLEQLEKRFYVQTSSGESVDKAESKTNDTASDDEWSDFVSVIQPQTPITNILNKNLLKQQSNDEDDWSEFVSSTPSNLQRLPRNTISIGTNSNYEAIFESWDTPFQTIPTRNMNNYILPSNRLEQPVNGEPSTFRNTQPSVISLPNLEFVAPKSLLNMPKRPIAKK